MKLTLKTFLPSAALLTALVSLGTAVPTSNAAPVSGSYTFLGTTTPTDQTGPWNMTSTDSTFAVLRFVLDTPVLFSDLTDLNYGYDSNLGGIGQGAPRSVFVFDNSNTLTLHWGPAGSFVDPTIGDNLNTGNLLGLNDLGRYDLTGSGGSSYTDRNAALALAGGWNVTRVSLIIDSFQGANRDFDINSTNLSASVPETGSTLPLLGLAVLGMVGFSNRRKAVLA